MVDTGGVDVGLSTQMTGVTSVENLDTMPTTVLDQEALEVMVTAAGVGHPDIQGQDLVAGQGHTKEVTRGAEVEAVAGSNLALNPDLAQGVQLRILVTRGG